MDSRKAARNFGVALLVQGWAFVVSAITAFLVPKVLGSDQFGYWQLFLFYVSYVGFSQFGLGEGVYLRFGGASRETVDTRSVSRQFVIGAMSQLVVCGFTLILAGHVDDPFRRFVLVAVGIMAPIMNAKRYWGFVFQAIDETKRFSYSVLVEVTTFFFLMAGLLIYEVRAFEPYVVGYVVGQIVSLGYCLGFSRGLLVFEGFKWRRAIADTLLSLRPGGTLLFAALAGTLILGVARFAVDRWWDVRVFGLVSLAVTVVTFFLSLMAQAAMVLYPVLRQASRTDQSVVLERLRAMSLAVFPIVYILYFPISSVLGKWLPEYSQSFVFAALIMPIAVFDGLMQVVHSTHLKVARRERVLMLLNVSAVVVSSLMVLVAGLLLKRLDLVLLAPGVAAGIRALLADRILVNDLDLSQKGDVVALCCLGAVFLVTIMFLGRGLSLGMFGLAYLAYLVWRRKYWVSALASTIASLRRPRQAQVE